MRGYPLRRKPFVFDFPVRLSFVPLVSPRTGKVSLGEKMIFTHLASFLYTDLCKGMAAGNLPHRCQNCGKWFLAQGGVQHRLLRAGGAWGNKKRPAGR